MDEKDIRITALCMRNAELEKDREDLIKLLKSIQEFSLAAYERDAECPYCKSKHWEMHEHQCF